MVVPDQGGLYPRLEPDQRSFPHATAFLGDYSNIAVTANGGVVAYWTDMREDVSFAGVTRKGEDAFFAATS